MSDTKNFDFERDVVPLLPHVSKPARYTGGEYNSVVKPGPELVFALAYPDVYEIGMSNLGLRILYQILNDIPEAAAERVYLPWPDLIAHMQERNIPLWTLETKRPVRSADILGITLQYEMTYTNILLLLELAGIPLHAASRGDSDPLVVGGGPCAFNPIPLAPYFDLIALGDGEATARVLAETVLAAKREGLDRAAVLERLGKYPWAYIPAREGAGPGAAVQAGSSAGDGANALRRTRAYVADLGEQPFPRKQLVPNVRVIQDRGLVEVSRGCTTGCRFCHAGMTYRPVRERKLDDIMHIAEEIVSACGFDEISLASLSISDYSCLPELITGLNARLASRGVSFSLPSLHVDSFTLGTAALVGELRKSGLTFAVEAGDPGLRARLNKAVHDDHLLEIFRTIYAGGWKQAKVYFMVGFPDPYRAGCGYPAPPRMAESAGHRAGSATDGSVPCSDMDGAVFARVSGYPAPPRMAESAGQRAGCVADDCVPCGGMGEPPAQGEGAQQGDAEAAHTFAEYEIQAIGDFLERVRQAVPRLALNITLGVFIPKPHTPLQWARQLSIAEGRAAIEHLRARFMKPDADTSRSHGRRSRSEARGKKGNIRITYHLPEMSFLEGVFARGGEKAARLLEKAYRLGARFDAWDEHFNFSFWREAMEALGFSEEEFLDPSSDPSSPLPWDGIGGVAGKGFLKNELQKYFSERPEDCPTPDCRMGYTAAPGASCTSYASCAHPCGVCRVGDAVPRGAEGEAVRTAAAEGVSSPEPAGGEPFRPASPAPIALHGGADTLHTGSVQKRCFPSMSAEWGEEDSNIRSASDASDAQPPAQSCPDRDASRFVYRLRFAKRGLLRFVSHLDMQSHFLRLFTRSGLPISLSEGFNPKARLSLIAPAMLGMATENDLLEIELREHFNEESLLEVLRPILPQGLELYSARLLPTLHSKLVARISAHHYRARRPLCEGAALGGAAPSQTRADADGFGLVYDCAGEQKLRAFLENAWGCPAEELLAAGLTRDALYVTQNGRYEDAYLT